MVWVAGEGVVGGGTEFPRLAARRGAWCRFVECEGEGEDGSDGEGEGGGEGGEGAAGGETQAARKEGVVFKVIPGNAVYWENFRPDGSRRGWDQSWHAGLPVKEGVKVGLNIWSWGRIE
ncbi:hypothetical protein HYQ44_005329 [Verticillium longisporum]|nr:hypothetical protein HYQ44_005329 [Verticillium longisporum]